MDRSQSFFQIDRRSALSVSDRVPGRAETEERGERETEGECILRVNCGEIAKYEL